MFYPYLKNLAYRPNEIENLRGFVINYLERKATIELHKEKADSSDASSAYVVAALSLVEKDFDACCYSLTMLDEML